jgi:hypothetical protein
VLVRFGKIAVIAALVATMGTHWVLLQSVAWTAMFADNLHSVSFREALVKTFDGKHPCYLCKAIAKGKTSEQRKVSAERMQKLEFPPAKANFILMAPSQPQLVRQAMASAESLPHAPPTPPPRGFFI